MPTTAAATLVAVAPVRHGHLGQGELRTKTPRGRQRGDGVERALQSGQGGRLQDVREMQAGVTRLPDACASASASSTRSACSMKLPSTQPRKQCRRSRGLIFMPNCIAAMPASSFPVVASAALAGVSATDAALAFDGAGDETALSAPGRARAACIEACVASYCAARSPP